MSTASSLEITLKSKIPCRRLVMPATPVAVPDDTEVVPPKSQKRISQRYRTTQRSSLPRAAEPKAMAEKTQRLSASARDHSARKATAHTGLP